jgi:hypothetical protein
LSRESKKIVSDAVLEHADREVDEEEDDEEELDSQTEEEEEEEDEDGYVVYRAQKVPYRTIR